MITFKYTDSSNTVVHVIDSNGISRQSVLASTLTPEQLATVEAYTPTAETLAAEALRIQDEAERAEVKSIPFVNFLSTHTPAQIANRIQNDIVQDGVEQVLVRMGKVLGYLCKKELR